MKRRCASSGICCEFTQPGRPAIQPDQRVSCQRVSRSSSVSTAARLVDATIIDPRQPRPKTKMASATRRCTRRRKATNGTLSMKGHIGVDSQHQADPFGGGHGGKRTRQPVTGGSCCFGDDNPGVGRLGLLGPARCHCRTRAACQRLLPTRKERSQFRHV